MHLMNFFPRTRLIVTLLALAASAGALTGCASLPSWMPGATASTPVASTGAMTGSTTSGVQTVKDRRFLGILSPYRVDIQQGNFISREMVAQVKENMKSKEGMTQDQVRFVMGTPLVSDVFHDGRWDYVFRLEKSNGDLVLSNVSLYFEGNMLKRLDGGDLPTEKDYLALIAGTVSAPPPDVEIAPAKKPGAK